MIRNIFNKLLISLILISCVPVYDPGGSDYSTTIENDTFTTAEENSTGEIVNTVTGIYYDLPTQDLENEKCFDKRIFLTDDTFSGNHLYDADKICQVQAEKVWLNGTFKAWISIGAKNPDNSFIKNDCKYYILKNGVKIIIANNYEDLTDGTIINSIDSNQYEEEVIGEVFTNTNFNGKEFSAANNCYNGTSTEGSILIGNTEDKTKWTVKNYGYCSDRKHLYCVEQ